jgi:chondroitin sulfate synthase
LIETKRNFSRSIGREMGAEIFSSDSLIFFIDVDVIFTRDFLFRVRLETIQNRQVYFPIVYSEFDPNPRILVNIFKRNRTLDGIHFNFNNMRGYWRIFGAGNIGTYKSDYMRVGRFDTSIIGWGNEDVNVYEKYSRSSLKILRVVDKGLVHIYHTVRCADENLPKDRFIVCIGTQLNTFISKQDLADLVMRLLRFLEFFPFNLLS